MQSAEAGVHHAPQLQPPPPPASHDPLPQPPTSLPSPTPRPRLPCWSAQGPSPTHPCHLARATNAFALGRSPSPRRGRAHRVRLARTCGAGGTTVGTPPPPSWRFSTRSPPATRGSPRCGRVFGSIADLCRAPRPSTAGTAGDLWYSTLPPGPQVCKAISAPPDMPLGRRPDAAAPCAEAGGRPRAAGTARPHVTRVRPTRALLARGLRAACAAHAR